MKNNVQKTVYVVCDKWYQLFDKVNFTCENSADKYVYGYFPFLNFEDAKNYNDESENATFIYRVVVALPGYDELLTKVLQNEVYERSEIEEDLFDQEVEIITRYDPDFDLSDKRTKHKQLENCEDCKTECK